MVITLNDVGMRKAAGMITEKMWMCIVKNGTAKWLKYGQVAIS
jgi:hypothetical protein